MQVQDIRPLLTKAKLDDILDPPEWIKNFCCKRKQDFHHCLRKTLLEEMEIKMPKSESDLVGNPFLLLGYGVNSFFDIQSHLSVMFLIISAFLLPVFLWYS